MKAPLAWVRRIASEIPELNTIPLFGNAPRFDWGRFSASLSKQFALPHLEVRAREQTWREGATEIKKGLGSHVQVVSIAVSPLGTVYWLISHEDLVKLSSMMLKKEGPVHPLSSEILQEGFYRYLLLEALHQLQITPPFENLTLQISEEEESFEKAFCIDVEIGKRCWGRLAIPAEFRKEWVSHFSTISSEYVPSELARQTQVAVGLKTGSIVLSQKEWKTIEAGDFVLLDRGSYDPRHQKGLAMLMLGSTPLFNVSMDHHKITLADYAFYYEDNMENKGEAPSDDQISMEEGEVAALKELPLYVTVEIARIKMSLDHLMSLQPGNTLDLPIHPDQGVSLTIQGQKVGRAELVYLGEQLGLRILEIG